MATPQGPQGAYSLHHRLTDGTVRAEPGAALLHPVDLARCRHLGADGIMWESETGPSFGIALLLKGA